MAFLRMGAARRFRAPVPAAAWMLLAILGPPMPVGAADTQVTFVFFPEGGAEVGQAFDIDLRWAACRMILDVATASEVVGFADRQGPREFNQRLSERRATAAASRLAQHGVPCERHRRVAGFGEDDTAHPTEDQPFSRRAEILVSGGALDRKRVEDCAKTLTVVMPSAPRCAVRP